MLDAAETVFAAKGFGGASMEEIAAEAGFSRASLYTRFSNKEDLLGAVLERQIARGVAAFGAMAVPATPLEGAAEAAAIFRRRTSLERVPLSLELRSAALRNPALRRQVAEADRQLVAEMARLIERNMEGTTRRLQVAPEDLAVIGNAAVSGLMEAAALDDAVAERFEELVETLFVVLTAPYGPPPDLPAATGPP
jgi:AcrR family transcriptional regulator